MRVTHEFWLQSPTLENGSEFLHSLDPEQTFRQYGPWYVPNCLHTLVLRQVC